MKILNRSGSFYWIFLTLMSLVAVFFLWSCYPSSGLTDAGDYDMIITQYDPEKDFGSIVTYAMPDSVIHIVPEDEEDEINREYDEQILAEVEENMNALGYQKMTPSPGPGNNADVNLLVYATQTQWQGWSWYPGWGGWWGWYPPYYGPGYPGSWVPYTFNTGTVAMDMTDNSTYNPADSTAQTIWGGAILGLLGDSKSNIEYRLTRDIDQAFRQSPYLGR